MERRDLTERVSNAVDGALASLESALHLAVQAGVLTENFTWSAKIEVKGRDPWIAVLSVGEVYRKDTK